MSTFEEQIGQLKVRAEARESIRYPEDFKTDAVTLVGKLREEGWTQTSISESLDIRNYSLEPATRHRSEVLP